MSEHDTAPASFPDWTHWVSQPMALGDAWTGYLADAWQRGVLYADIRRQRDNQYRSHLEEQVPTVLDFASEPVMSGQDLPRPVNYWLVRIHAPEGTATDPTRRPFIVVDPRAGHGPGIGGFKPDSEIGAALKAGHPCYFIGFLPDPVHGQTVEDVMRAEAAFVRRVSELHPQAIGKPVVIGNCQAGWQILMTAAVWPELFGPIIVAGAPVSYWAGDNPMRYAGGLMGGSWMTALTSDVGAGRFDGAWLVQNFENLDPANTLWTKQYNVYANVDTEGPRYLGFEKYWGGHVFMEGAEMQYIVDNLFIGNRLSSAQLSTSDGVRIDLRNIRSPIVVFCSYGDNITPPGQALGWITDLYRDDGDIAGHDQTIVFATHDSIGHLGIFVSGAVGRKEHREFAANIDLIDLIPAGIYRAEVLDRPAGVPADQLTDHEYLMTIRRSGIEEVRAIVAPDPDSDRRFAASARISEINLALYRNMLQPWVQAVSTPAGARLMQAFHPLRMGYEWWSDRHPLAALVQSTAEQVRQGRQPVAADNPFLQVQAAFSEALVGLLDHYRDHRDAIYAMAFDTLYGTPAMQALAGQSVREPAPARPHPGDSPEHRAYLAAQMAQLDAAVRQGGLAEAVIRALFYIFWARGEADERHFRHAWQIVMPYLDTRQAWQSFRVLTRQQGLLMRRDIEASVAAIPDLLCHCDPALIQQAVQAITEVVSTSSSLTAEERRGLERMLGLFGSPAPTKKGKTTPRPKPGATAARPAKTAGSTAKPAARRATAKTALATKAAPAAPARPGPRKRGRRAP